MPQRAKPDALQQVEKSTAFTIANRDNYSPTDARYSPMAIKLTPFTLKEIQDMINSGIEIPNIRKVNIVEMNVGLF